MAITDTKHNSLRIQTDHCPEYLDTDDILKELTVLKESVDHNFIKIEFEKVIEKFKWKSFKNGDVLETLFFDKKIVFELSNWILRIDDKLFKIADSFTYLSFSENEIAFSWSDNICLSAKDWEEFSTFSKFNYTVSYSKLLDLLISSF